MALSLRHSFPTDPQTYWTKIFFDEEYNRRLFVDALGFRLYEVLEQREEADGTKVRKVRVRPASDPPAAVKKVMGEAPTSVEEGRWDPKTMRYTFHVTPGTLPDKIKITGETRTEKTGEKSMDRIVSATVAVSIFGIGGILESFIERTMRESYERGAEFTKRFIAEKGL